MILMSSTLEDALEVLMSMFRNLQAMNNELCSMIWGTPYLSIGWKQERMKAMSERVTEVHLAIQSFLNY